MIGRTCTDRHCMNPGERFFVLCRDCPISVIELFQNQYHKNPRHLKRRLGCSRKTAAELWMHL